MNIFRFELILIACNQKKSRLRSEKAFRPRFDKKSLKCASEFVPKRETRKKFESFPLHVDLTQSLLNIPSIYVEKEDSQSNISALFDGSSLSEEDLSTPELSSLMDADTVSMIVRNVEAFEKMEAGNEKTDEFIEVALPATQERSVSSPQKIEGPKKHDFMHDIQEKLHHITDNIKRHELMHKTDSPPREHGKTKEMLLDLKENVSGRIHQIAEKMHNFHLPQLTHNHSQGVPQDGLVGQAMQTILMEKFNIVEATQEANQKRRPSSSSLQSIKHKFNLFQRPRRSVELQSETSSLKSISEVQSPENFEKKVDEPKVIEAQADSSSILELNIHEEPESGTSNESLITILSKCDRKEISKDDLLFSSVDSSDSFMSTHKTFSKIATFTDTNKSPLHASLLSLSRNEMLSTSPAVRTHTRNESVGFAASPSKHVSNSLGKDQITTGIHRRSSDSDLSITPKGEL